MAQHSTFKATREGKAQTRNRRMIRAAKYATGPLTLTLDY